MGGGYGSGGMSSAMGAEAYSGKSGLSGSGAMSSGQGMMAGGGSGPPGASGGYPGASGGYPGASGQGGGAGQITMSGPLLAEETKEKIQVIDRTDFVVQFVWIPTLEKDRKEVDPRPDVEEGADTKKAK